MENKTLKQMKASEIHRIMAQVLEIVEKAQFTPQVDVGIKECSDHPEKWKMVFLKNNTSLEELTGLKNKLGQNFNVNVAPRDKSMLLITIEAPSADFVALNQQKG